MEYPIDKMKKVLEEFISTIDNTGGVVLGINGLYVPVVDEEWVDLGEAYMSACMAIDHRPVIYLDD